MFNEGITNVHDEYQSDCPSVIADELLEEVNAEIRDFKQTIRNFWSA